MSPVEVFESTDGWRFRIKARNGEIVAQSEAYGTKADAIRGVRDMTTAVMQGQQDTSSPYITFAQESDV